MALESWYPKRVARAAVVWNGNFTDIPAEWRRLGAFDVNPDGDLWVHTNHGLMRADIGDYLVRDVAGTFYPVKAAVFEATYEKA